MNILIDNNLYNRIYLQIGNQIIGGALKENELLPSIRGLTKDLRISFLLFFLIGDLLFLRFMIR